MVATHAASPLQALYRVFVLPNLIQSLPPRSLHPRIYSARTSKLQQQQQRSFSASYRHLAKTRAAETRTQKWDEEIRSRLILLVNENGTIDTSPRTRFDVLNTLDRKTHRLVQLSPDEPGNPDYVPTCKIISKKESYEQNKKKKKQAAAKGKAGEAAMKTLELNWAIDGNDLGHRLRRVGEFLEEGRRVELVLAAKKAGRKASEEECNSVLQKIRETVEGVKGAKEAKMDGKVGGFATLVLEGSKAA